MRAAPSLWHASQTMSDAVAWLVLVSDGGFGRKYRLGENTTLGRHEECDLQLVDALVSKQHARITRIDGAYRVVDLASRNGVFVNGARVQGDAPLRANDRLAIGDHVFLFDPDVALLPEDEGDRLVLITPAATLVAGRALRA
jgi:pSer/pThr/pTyr-binding forkhead associated (FHA) protein